MAGFTNKLKAELLASFFQGEVAPASFYLALVTADNVPGPDTNTLSDLTEIAVGNGYGQGGIVITKNAAGFPTFVEDDPNDQAFILLKDIKWTAGGGPIPKTGNGARYAVLTGPGASVGDRKVYLWISLGRVLTVSDSQELRINGMRADLLETAA